MDKTYGIGLTGLIHPVTKEFNHKAVIQDRGGRNKNEHLGSTTDIGLNQALDGMHNLVVGTPSKFMSVGGR
jgi:hypothetical protein